MPELRVATWNVFHGRGVPAQRRDLFPQFAATLASGDWELCALQELPPWWALPLAHACGASLRVTRTSLLRGACPSGQRRVSTGDPERLGARGAAVNALLIRPSAGWIVDHRSLRLRRVPQRRTMHAVMLARPGGHTIWVAGTHTHNRPEHAAGRDLAVALTALRRWSTTADAAILLGDVNLTAPAATQLAADHRWRRIAGDRVDHVLASDGVTLVATSAEWPRCTASAPAHLSDHRLVCATLRLPNQAPERRSR